MSNKAAMKKDTKSTLTPKLRFPEFRGTEGWKLISLGEASVPVTKRVGQRKLTPVSISAGIGFVPQAEKFGRDISGKQYQLYTLVSDGDFVYNKGNSLKFPQGCVYQLQGWGWSAPTFRTRAMRRWLGRIMLVGLWFAGVLGAVSP
ncbi:hypothetical protein [Ruficoccus amylovorans]|uniref:hypothetical protein n=1 Tax=Ruficoccus amylovorans TaxID=1804625 RepID=UPI001C8CB396|nr:hypothetical protein [Ruficoccus amylovorans]